MTCVTCAKAGWCAVADAGAAGAQELIAQGPAAAGAAVSGPAPGAAGRLLRRGPGHEPPAHVQAALRQRVLHLHCVLHLFGLFLALRLVHFRVR